jgi:hypothetical protein
MSGEFYPFRSRRGSPTVLNERPAENEKGEFGKTGRQFR